MLSYIPCIEPNILVAYMRHMLLESPMNIHIACHTDKYTSRGRNSMYQYYVLGWDVGTNSGQINQVKVPSEKVCRTWIMKGICNNMYSQYDNNSFWPIPTWRVELDTYMLVLTVLLLTCMCIFIYIYI